MKKIDELKNKIDKFPVVISQVDPMDFKFPHMALTDYELLVSTIYKLNELIDVTNKYYDLVTEFIDWITNEGLTAAVVERLNEWLIDGTLGDLVNDVLFNSKLDKTEFEEFKTSNNISLSLKADKEDLINLENKVSGYFVSVKEFGAIGDYDTALKTGFDNETPFKEALLHLKNKGGGTLFIPNGDYGFKNKTETYLTIDSDNITIIGESHNAKIHEIGFQSKGKSNIHLSNFSIFPNEMYTCGYRTLASDLDVSVSNITVNDMVIDNCYDGILFFKVTNNITAKNNTVTRAHRIGITFDYVSKNFICENNSVYDSKQGFHFEMVKDGVIRDNFTENCGMMSTVKVPNDQQPDSYAGSFLFSGTYDAVVENNKVKTSDSVKVFIACNGIKFIRNKGFGAIEIHDQTSFNFTLIGNEKISVASYDLGRLEGVFIFKDNDLKGGGIDFSGDVSHAIIKNNINVGRINMGSNYPLGYGYMENNQIETPTFNNFNFAHTTMKDTLFKSIAAEETDVSMVGFKVESAIVKTFFLDNLIVQPGSRAGYVIYIIGKIDNAVIGNFFGTELQMGGTSPKYISYLNRGDSSQRPTFTVQEKGYMYYDTQLNKPIWWDGSNWKTSEGVNV